MLRSIGLNAIRVGSIDDYQGQEENVVIVSTVFAGPHLSNASRGNKLDLGLLGNPRRFNVAVTRASSLLVVIGKSNSIRHDMDGTPIRSFSNLPDYLPGAFLDGGGLNLPRNY